jgi:hypothetical protein
MSLREHTRAGLGRVEPCLPSPAKAPPSGPGWLHEIKHDGFRILARRDSAGVRLINRAGNDFSSRLRAARARAETARHSTRTYGSCCACYRCAVVCSAAGVRSDQPSAHQFGIRSGCVPGGGLCGGGAGLSAFCREPPCSGRAAGLAVPAPLAFLAGLL